MRRDDPAAAVAWFARDATLDRPRRRDLPRRSRPARSRRGPRGARPAIRKPRPCSIGPWPSPDASGCQARSPRPSTARPSCWRGEPGRPRAGGRSRPAGADRARGPSAPGVHPRQPRDARQSRAHRISPTAGDVRVLAASGAARLSIGRSPRRRPAGAVRSHRRHAARSRTRATSSTRPGRRAPGSPLMRPSHTSAGRRGTPRPTRHRLVQHHADGARGHPSRRRRPDQPADRQRACS